MITSLRIRNFQRHRDLKIKLDPAITTIVGPTDAGKSAIIRALKWLALNQPRGASFKKHGADRVSVTARTDDSTYGDKVTRSKGAKNSYILNDVVYAAFGSDVPKPVSDVLQLSEINFQDQHDNPTSRTCSPAFWFSESPAEVSRRLNDIVDLSVIDSTMAYLSGNLRKAKLEMTVVEERLKKARAERAELKVAKEARAELVTLEKMAKRIATGRQRATTLEELVAQAESYRGAHVDALADAEDLLEIGQRWAAKYRSCKDLEERVDEGTKASKLAAAKIPDLSELVRLGGAAERLSGNASALKTLVEAGIKERMDQDYYTEVEKEARKTLKKEMGDTCALCGSSLENQS